MWIILLLVCFYQSTSSLGQEQANYDRQIVIDSSEVNQEVKWDSTRPPVTLSIRSGRSDRINRTQDAIQNDDQRLFYSNEWRPILMPIGLNSQRDDRNKYQLDSVYSPYYQFPPTFLRRPDSDQNRNVSSDSSSAEINKRDTPSPTQLPMAPMMFYPPPFRFYPNGGNLFSNSNVLQNSSTIVPSRRVSESAATNSDESQSETSQTENFPVTSDFPRRFYPEDFYRNMGGLLPPRSYIPPYPFLPYSGIQPFQTMFNPNFDREVGTGGSIQPLGVSQPGIGSNPDLVGDNEANPEESIAGQSPTNVAPLPPYPFPAGGYPYSLMPPPVFAPPFISNFPSSTGRSVLPSGPLSRDPFIANFPPRGVPFNPLYPPRTDIIPETPASGEVLPPPISEANPLLESGGVIPQVADLQPGSEVPAELKAAADILESETQNAVKLPYEFGFDMNDGQGTDQHRKEVSDGSGVVTGSYGYNALGVYRMVNYIADKDGFRAFIKSNEPGVASAGSANVVVIAESPPPRAIAEGLKASEPQAIVVPDEIADLVAAGSETESK